MDYSTQRYIPAGAAKVANKSGSAVAYLFTSKFSGKLCAIGYRGKAKNAAFNYSFRSAENRATYVTDFLAKAEASAKQVAASKAQKKADMAKPTTLRAGDVLNCVWGYDQTNVEYFEVTKLIGPRMVEIRQIASQSQQDGDMQGTCVPAKGKYISEPMRKKVTLSEGVRIYSFASAYKVESKKVAGMEIFTPQRWTAYA